ncbi:MAG: phage portal protein [Planctomycetia bacterium]|nr:phage portal protein [Planctomycetia bacterium]
MPQTRIDSTSASDLTNAITDFSVDNASTDGASEQKETTWIDENWSVDFGYYTDDKIPEITAVIDAKSAWTVGKGFVADEITTMLLDTIKGWGKDTFNTILENAMRTMLISGNFYAEIIRDDEENLINLKPLDSGTMRHVVNKQGILIRFEQLSKIKENPPKKFKPEDIFYLARNRVADEIHGRGIIQKLKRIMDMKNEAMNDSKLINHRFAYPQWIFHLDTDDPTEIAKFKATKDAANAAGENMYIPKDVVVPELVAVAPNATINLLPWIQYLDNLLYEMAGVPKIILGGSGEFTEASAKIAYLAFQQGVEEEQLFIEEQVLTQLNLVINLEFPASLENELLSDNKKDGAQNIDPSETTAGEGQ